MKLKGSSIDRIKCKPVITVVIACVLSACGSTAIKIDEIFPPPLIEPFALHMGVHFSPELSDYVHEEEVEQNGTWKIALGAAQRSMFNQILSGMFQQITAVPALENFAEINAALDAVIIPEIQDFQFSVPSQTRTTYYEIWIKYQMNLYTPTGELIAQWPLTAYGKSNTDNFGFMEKTRQPAVQQATRVALRDAAAFFALGFSQETKVKDWLARMEDG